MILVKDKKGFTLIEVIGVFIILAILATLATVQYASTVNKGRERLNAEQKSRIVETAKNISLTNRNCLTQAKNDPVGVKISLADMKKYGYVANTLIKDLEENVVLESCVIIKWDQEYSKFNYEYSDTCPEINTCLITPETEKVLVSSFYLGDGNPSYINSQTISYHLKYSSSINAEYCVTLENEASCNWKKLDLNNTDVSGTLTLENTENIAHLYIRNSNKNIIVSITDSVIYDTKTPTCTWLSPSSRYVKNGSDIDVTLRCQDEAGIKNTELLKDNIIISNESLASITDATIVESGSSKDFKFSLTGLAGNGNVTLQLKSDTISDNSGNVVSNVITSGSITVDNIAPNGTVLVKNDANSGSIYTNNETIELKISDVSSDIDSVCISNIDNNCTGWQDYVDTYNWMLQTGDGAKTVYVSLRDKAGNVNQKNTVLYLDKTAPTCTITPYNHPANFYYQLKEGNYVDYSVTCTDNLAIADNILTTANLSKDNQFLEAEVISSDTNRAIIRVTAASGNGTTNVFIRANSLKDKAGNSNSKTIPIVTLITDNIPPYNNSVLANYGANITNNRLAIMTLNTDSIDGYYCLTLTDSAQDCTWNRYYKTGNISLGNAIQEYTIYAFFKDLAGNISQESVKDTIKYDPDALSCNLVVEDDKMKITSSYKSLDANPYSWDNNVWSSNNEKALSSSVVIYRGFIKDIEGNINYYETAYDAN